MPSLSTLEQFTAKLEQPRTGQLKGGQDWLFDWLVLLALDRFVTEYHFDKNSTTHSLKNWPKWPVDIGESSGHIGAFNELSDMLERIFHHVSSASER
jgi:hypothetical protein